MKIALTGHTRGLGLAFFNYFLERDHTVVGISRTSGYDLTNNIEEITNLIKSCDLFINNAHVGTSQAILIEKLYNTIPIITIGSIASDYVYTGDLYRIEKLVIETTHKKFKKITNYPMLLLKPGFLENFTDKQSIPYQQIINSIEFWLNNPRVSLIELDNIHYDTDFK